MKIPRPKVANWTNLPNDAFSCIAPRLSCLEDLYRLSAVCQAWQTSTASAECPSLGLKFPLLMLVKDKDDEGESSKDDKFPDIGDFNMLMFRVCKKQLTGGPHRGCMGAKFGWLTVVDEDLNFQLFHPFSKKKIQLPPCTARHLPPCTASKFSFHREIFPDVAEERALIWKAALSSNPLEKMTADSLSKECVIMGIFSHSIMQTLAFARLSDEGWTTVGADEHDFEDVIYFKDKFYSIDADGALFVCDVNVDMPTCTLIASVETDASTEKYLVESSGDLCLVLRGFPETAMSKITMGDRPNCWPHDIFVFKLNECSSAESGYDLERVMDLGHAAFLLGASSLSILAPGVKGCFRRNRIFIVDDDVYDRLPPSQVSVYDVGDGTYEIYDFSKFSESSSSLAPLWYI